MSRSIRVQSLKNKAVIADQCLVAERFLDRLRGLIGTRVLERGRGMFFPRCNNIHMWFMRIPIDVVFVRRKEPGTTTWQVTSVHEGVKPWRALPLWDRGASETLELPAGTIQLHAIAPGDELWSN